MRAIFNHNVYEVLEYNQVRLAYLIRDAWDPQAQAFWALDQDVQILPDPDAAPQPPLNAVDRHDQEIAAEVFHLDQARNNNIAGMWFNAPQQQAQIPVNFDWHIPAPARQRGAARIRVAPDVDPFVNDPVQDADFSD